jgi:antitoxin component of MazEF toxin-antitoxin module
MKNIPLPRRGAKKKIKDKIMTIGVTNDSRKPLVVPAKAIRRAGFRPGDELELKVSGSAITIAPKAVRASGVVPLVSAREQENIERLYKRPSRSTAKTYRVAL